MILFRRNITHTSMFKSKSRVPEKINATSVNDLRQKEIETLDRETLVSILCNSKSIAPITRAEASIAASYMRARQYSDGKALVLEGDTEHCDHMLWILHGEAVVEALPTTSSSAPITMTVLGPGATIGELSLMDGGPRSLTCTASGDIRCAVLTQTMLQRMGQEHPEVALKLVSSVFIGMTLRMRDLTEKLKRFIRLNQTMNDALLETTIMQVLR
jgi:CRP/FNR family transcriptional regulator, cyclic AMP receptor protein